MKSKSPIDKAKIESAIQHLAEDRAFVRKLLWWLRYGNASERWFQFELAYQLDRITGDRYAVACEHRRMDIALFSLDAGAEKANTPAAGVEVHWFGNWAVNRAQLDELHEDIAAVDTYIFPAVALAACLFVKPTTRKNTGKPPTPYSWLAKHFELGREGVASIAQLKSVLHKTIGQPLVDIATVWLEVPQDLQGAIESLQLHTVGYYNPQAVAALAQERKAATA